MEGIKMDESYNERRFNDYIDNNILWFTTRIFIREDLKNYVKNSLLHEYDKDKYEAKIKEIDLACDKIEEIITSLKV